MCKFDFSLYLKKTMFGSSENANKSCETDVQIGVKVKVKCVLWGKARTFRELSIPQFQGE